MRVNQFGKQTEQPAVFLVLVGVTPRKAEVSRGITKRTYRNPVHKRWRKKSR